jgi:hypothetical protein
MEKHIERNNVMRYLKCLLLCMVIPSFMGCDDIRAHEAASKVGAQGIVLCENNMTSGPFVYCQDSHREFFICTDRDIARCRSLKEIHEHLSSFGTIDVDNFLERCERPKDPSNNEEDER